MDEHEMTGTGEGQTTTGTAAENTDPVEPSAPAPGQGTRIEDRLRQLREVAAQGGDVLQAAMASSTRPAYDPNRPRQDQEPGAVPPDREPEPSEQPADAAILARLKDAFKSTDDRRPGDPEGTYRDAAGRLRDAVDHRFLPEPDGQAKAGQSGVAKAAGDDEPPAELVVELPGRRPDDPPYKFVARDKNEAERLRQAINAGMRRAEFNEQMAALERRERAVQQLLQEFEQQPAQFVAERIGPEHYGAVVEALLSRLDQETFDRLVDRMAAWVQDPVARREAALAAREQDIERRRQAEEEARRAAAQDEYLQGIAQQIVGVIPDEWPDARADEFFEYAAFKLRQYARQNRGVRIRPVDVPALLEQLGVLRAYGLAQDGRGQPSAGAVRSPDGAPPRSPAPSAEIERAQRAGEGFRKRAERRAQAVATAPAGTGAATPGLPFPPGQHIRDRLKTARKWLLGRDA